jgi:hypothetical protein
VRAAGRSAAPGVPLPEPVLALARAAVLALALLAPVLALLWGLFRIPALTTAKPVVLVVAASTAASVCALAVANSARKGTGSSTGGPSTGGPSTGLGLGLLLLKLLYERWIVKFEAGHAWYLLLKCNVIYYIEVMAR